MNSRLTPVLQNDTLAEFEKPVGDTEVILQDMVNLFSQDTGTAIMEQTTLAGAEEITHVRIGGVMNIQSVLGKVSEAFKPGTKLETFTVDLDSPVATRINKYLGDMWPHYFHFLNVDGDMYINDDNGNLLGIRQAKR